MKNYLSQLKFAKISTAAAALAFSFCLHVPAQAATGVPVVTLGLEEVDVPESGVDFGDPLTTAGSVGRVDSADEPAAKRGTPARTTSVPKLASPKLVLVEGRMEEPPGGGVPEPSSMAFLGSALALATLRRRR